jgi:hypothetical protein
MRNGKPRGRGRWIERISGRKITRLAFETKTASAARTVVADGDRTGFPHIESIFVLRTPASDARSGEHIDEVRMYMTLEDASKYAQDLISAIQAATPRIPGPSYRLPFE